MGFLMPIGILVMRMSNAYWHENQYLNREAKEGAYGFISTEIVNIYTGLQARIWNWHFSVEVAVIAFIYLFQQKWHYINQSGVILGNESVLTTDQQTSPTDEKKEMSPMPSSEPC
ncbi:uncharacterized protein LOC107828778 [Nicotiana tabacum]|uniref:Cytochrome b561 domain-containing protein At4g18260-like n=1 Tax=Nicotiana tabacum TaxID=4097 RepID=A0A1S4DE69_TOBAC|nr:PREDICTED: cytochrome b561 domain-containing protein At4g18260-like [Nicotiana tabacum]